MKGDNRMKKHILLDKSESYKIPKEISEPKGCLYNRQLGYWVNQDTELAMMLGKYPERMQTKKHDIETGEDQKGE